MRVGSTPSPPRGATFLCVRVIVRVATWDQLRRKGFMKVVDPPDAGLGSLLFHMRDLPEPLRQLVIEASRALKPMIQNRRDGDGEAFRVVSANVKALVTHQRFAVEVAPRTDGRVAIVSGTVELVDAEP